MKFVSFLFALSATSIQAVTISLYTMPNGGLGISDVSEHTTDFTATTLTNPGGGGISATTGTAFAASNSTTGANTLADAIANSEYFSFTITAPVDCTASNINISYDWVVTDGDTNATVNYTTFLLTDALPFADGNELDSAAIDDQNNPASTSLIGNTNNDIGALFTETETVSAAAGSLSPGQSMEIRLYYNDNSTSSNRFHRFDNIEVTADLTGAAHIPEPGTAFYGLLGILTLVRRKRA